MKVRYESNNSGGGWWLKDEDWHALEAAGWTVHWVRDDPDRTEDRWLGALATQAEKAVETPGAMRDFERITGRKVTEEGCNCCGPPHAFYWGTGEFRTNRSGETWELEDSAYGDACMPYLFPDQEIPGSVRDVLEARRAK